MVTKGENKKKQYTPNKKIPLTCSLPDIKERDLSHISDGNRARLIARMTKMWVNGTNLTYYFFRSPANWRGGSIQEQAVRDAFKSWKDLGIGLTFQEVDDAEEATIRIGFDQSDGAWSYVGRDCIDVAKDPAERTTNYGWDLTTTYGRDTALHEIGHILGFPHEHQNPKAGIIWDEDKVYENFAGDPNYWSKEKTDWNIIRKIPANTVDGSEWDKDSIMHYHFEAGLIKHPSEYQTQPLIPADGLSALDIETIRKLYPSLERGPAEIRPFESQKFNVDPGEQADFLIKPSFSREYTIQTFGRMDTVMVLFEMYGGTPVYIDGDDDSGLSYNAKITFRLHRGREYLVRTRLYYADSKGSGAIMLY
jgi:hypothetical protein